MFTTDYVGRELITVSAPVPADVAFEWVTKTVAPHVDGEHDIVQEDDPAVGARIDRPREGLTIAPHHP